MYARANYARLVAGFVSPYDWRVTDSGSSSGRRAASPPGRCPGPAGSRLRYRARMDTNALRTLIHDDMPRVIDELSRLVAIPSIGYPGYDAAHVRASAELTRDILAAAGVAGARLIELGDGHPAVFAEIAGPEGAPTILLYAHHDVQPEGDPAAWATGPFAPEIRDGRLYGRGAADDKAGIAVHAAALRALDAHEGAPLPVTVKIVVEGEEECSTEHLPQLVRGHADLLSADVAGSWPTAATTARACPRSRPASGASPTVG